MYAKIGQLAFGIALAASAAAAQAIPPVPKTSDIYCSGVVTTDAVPRDTYLISGEESNYKITFNQGDLVYINRGSAQGVKVGDEFLVTRPQVEPLKNSWFIGQPAIMRAMGTLYSHMGRLRVVSAREKVSIAEVVFSCDYMQRGDIVRPFEERPAPPLKQNVNFDRFAPASGNKVATIISGKNFTVVGGYNTIFYVNLGSAQGVKVGDYMRVFRYEGSNRETAYQTMGSAYRMYGFGTAPAVYKGSDLPREVLGEAIVLRVGTNSATVMLTVAMREIYLGDYVEIE